MLRALVAKGREYDSARLHELGTALGLPASDLFVVAGRSVPAHLLPPARDSEIVRDFTYRVTFCDHAQLAFLEGFVSVLASAGSASATDMAHDLEAAPPAMEGFSAVLDGLMRNRGLGIREMPFTGLSVSTINGMLSGRWHSLQQLKAMAGPLGWRFEDLAAVAGEPLGTFDDCSALCRHAGRVYVAAIPLSTVQLMQAAAEADRLSGRNNQGAWRPVATPPDPCPDETTRKTVSGRY